jgi:hypothetical protein
MRKSASPLRRLALVPALAASLGACTGWVAQPLPQGPEPATIHENRLRVTRANGEVVELTAAAVRGDTLYGFRTHYVTDATIALPLSDVARVEAARTSVAVPILLGLGAAGVLWRWVVFPWLAGS